MSTIYRLCALALLLVFAAAPAAAQTRVGSHLGLNFDTSDILLGVNVHFPVNAGDRELVAAPSVDFYLFEDNLTITRVNADVLLPVTEGGSFQPLVGAGLAVQIIGFDEEAICGPNNPVCQNALDSDTDFALNLRGGAIFGNPDSRIRPYADVALTLGAGTDAAVRGGVLFNITG